MSGRVGGGDRIDGRLRVSDDGTVLVRRDDGVEVAAFGNDRAPVEREQQGEPLEPVDTYVAGKRGRATRSADTITVMLRTGSITGNMARMANAFAGIFHIAQFPDMQAASIEWRPSGEDMSDERAAIMTEARRQVHVVITALGGHGSPAARAVWYVIGVGLSLDEWARRERFGNGRPLGRIAAGGVLVGALGVLEAVFDGRKFG